MTEEQRFRAMLCRKMTEIREELRGFVQTTHTPFVHGPAFDRFAETMKEAFRSPTAFNIAEFSHALERMWCEDYTGPS